MQLQLKQNMFSLIAIQKMLDEDIAESLNEIGKATQPGSFEKVRICMMNVLQDCLNLRKTSLVGCKMKIY
jgi:hypothetical protein